VVNDTAAIRATGMPCADSSTICARRQVTTDPVPLRMIRNRRCSSSPSISRTCTCSATRTAWQYRAVRTSVRTACHVTSGRDGKLRGRLREVGEELSTVEALDFDRARRRRIHEAEVTGPRHDAKVDLG